MNPIENLWAVLKQNIHEKSYETCEDIIDEVHRLWNNDPTLHSLCQTLSDSMPQRIKDCIRQRGSATKY
jgi:transposase